MLCSKMDPKNRRCTTVFLSNRIMFGEYWRVQIHVCCDAPRLSHPWFEERKKEGIYPNPMCKRKVLCFFSLWNQSVGQLMQQYKPHIYHCPDFHTCIAPWYALQNADPMEPVELRMLLVLHNAEYQGTVSTDMIRQRQCEKVARIFNVTEEFVFRHLTAEGRFNMLKAGVDFLLEYQDWAFGFLLALGPFQKDVAAGLSGDCQTDTVLPNGLVFFGHPGGCWFLLIFNP